MKVIKNHFVMVLSIGIIAIAVAGIYFFSQNSSDRTPSELEVINAIMENWEDIAPAGANLPHDIEFIGNNKVIVSYENNFQEYKILLSYDNDLAFTIIDRGSADTSSDRDRYVVIYGNPDIPFTVYQYIPSSGEGNGGSDDWVKKDTPPNINPPTVGATTSPIIEVDSGYIIIDNSGEPDRIDTRVKLKQGN